MFRIDGSIFLQRIGTQISILRCKIKSSLILADRSRCNARLIRKFYGLYRLPGLFVQAIQIAGTTAGIQIRFSGINTGPVISAAVVFSPDSCFIFLCLLRIFISGKQADQITVCKSRIQITGIISQCGCGIAADNVRVEP